MANEVVSTSKWYCFFLLNPAVTASFFETLAGGLAQPRAADLGVFSEDSLLLRSSLIRIALGDYVLNT